jgi:hypothetical protein
MTGSRIERSVRRTETAYSAMVTSKDVVEQQAAWEEFIADWRTALNQIATAAKRAGRNDIAADMHMERETSRVLDYVWEARNAEEHTPDGTSESAVHKVTKPFTFNNDPFTFNGKPFVFTASETVLAFRQLRRRGQALEPPEDEPIKVAGVALEFLQRCHARLQEA